MKFARVGRGTALALRGLDDRIVRRDFGRRDVDTVFEEVVVLRSVGGRTGRRATVGDVNVGMVAMTSRRPVEMTISLDRRCLANNAPHQRLDMVKGLPHSPCR